MHIDEIRSMQQQNNSDEKNENERDESSCNPGHDTDPVVEPRRRRFGKFLMIRS
jgi:hypothetical protein